MPSYSRRMDPHATVLVRERCPDCAGEGSRPVSKGTGHVSWSKTVSCATCEGTGHRSRWVELGELQRMLEHAPTRSE